MGEDVELCLEVQVDPASKKILSNPDKCRSTLLDVTVVKPKELEAFGTQITNTLRADEVRKLISSMEKQRRKKQKVLDKLKDDDTIIKIRKHEDFYDSHHRSRKPFTKHKERISPKTPVDDLERKDFIGIAESVEPLFCEIRRSLKNVETRISDMQDINLMISQTTVDGVGSDYFSSLGHKYSSQRPSSHLRNHSVYRVDASPKNLKSVLLCKNKQKLLENGDKIEGKCLCENCGIVGFLKECQKHPLLNELSESSPPSYHTKRGSRHMSKYENWRTKNYEETAYINELTNKIKQLEERLSAQEEKVVPKDYFKKIISRMVTNFSSKSHKSKSDTSLHCSEKHTKKKTVKSAKHSPRSGRTGKSHHCRSSEALHTCGCNTKKEKPKNTDDKATITDDEVLYGGYIWKWGEEILRPGIDLKNRIVTLLNDLLGKLALTEKSSNEAAKFKSSMKSDNYDSDMFKTFMQHMNTNVFNTHIDSRPAFLSNEYEKMEKTANFEPLHTSVLTEYSKKCRGESSGHHSRRESERYNKNVDVSYVNPKLSLWKTETPDKKKCEEVTVEKNNALGKHEFLKIVSKAKQHQRDTLWKNIWNQATANGQNKSDIITIKIPSQGKDGREGSKLFETEITIGEVEEILKNA